MEREDRDDAGADAANDARTDSADRLTGGYGGEPTPDQEREAEATAGSSDPRDLGSSALDSGLTAGGTDTTVDPGIDRAQP